MLVAVAALTAAVATRAHAQSTPWDSAERAIRRLPPSAFAQLPAPVRRDLERRGCTVPQAFYPETPHNVVSGQFTRVGRVEWAVLCSTRDSSRILVYGGDSATGPNELAVEADKGKLQTIGDGKIGYSRAIGRARPATMRRLATDFGGKVPEPLDHDGINDAFLEKASAIHYLHRGKWMLLRGMD
jgi:hypothetical protein